MNQKRRIGKLLLASTAMMMSAQALAALAPHVPGELIVKFKETNTKSLLSLKSVGAQIDRTIDLSKEQLHVVKIGNEKSLESVIERLNQDPNVVYAEPNFIYSLVKPTQGLTIDDFMTPLETPSSLSTPNDPRFGQLWGLQNTGSNEPNSSTPGVVGADIAAMKAWEITKGSRDVVIAVIDTGIDYNHEDLKDNMWVNPDPNAADRHGYNFVTNTPDPFDGNDHGTHCAGTIGAVHDNGLGVAGVMGEVQLMALKFLSDSGSGTTEAAIRAIDYATEKNVDIMSNSWGGGGRSQALEDAIIRANDKGILFVVAAGNSSSNNDSRPQYPANYEVPNVISVAASTAQDSLASFSCFGRNTVHIAAPGHRILSTTKRGGYSVFSGTSMAAPHVSGALGLLLAQEGGRMPVSEVRERLMYTSDPVATLRGKTTTGGRMNAHNLLTDFRPERNEPNPDGWVNVQLPEAWESAHPYGHGVNVSNVYTIEGAKYIRLRVTRYDTERGYDFIEVANAAGAVSERISGQGSDYASDYVEGDTLKVTFKSDGSVDAWGFLIESVDVQY